MRRILVAIHECTRILRDILAAVRRIELQLDQLIEGPDEGSVTLNFSVEEQAL